MIPPFLSLDRRCATKHQNLRSIPCELTCFYNWHWLRPSMLEFWETSTTPVIELDAVHVGVVKVKPLQLEGEEVGKREVPQPLQTVTVTKSPITVVQAHVFSSYANIWMIAFASSLTNIHGSYHYDSVILTFLLLPFQLDILKKQR